MSEVYRALIGAGNAPVEYGLVLAVYAALFLLMLHGMPEVELNFRRSFWVLYIGWVGLVFPGNYLCYRLGVMSFLPWLNNALHCFVWIGLCLGFLYSTVRRESLALQCGKFAIYSFIVKLAENRLLGTWELDHFFFIPGNWAYLIGWSLIDGAYPLISAVGLRWLSAVIPGLVVSESR